MLVKGALGHQCVQNKLLKASCVQASQIKDWFGEKEILNLTGFSWTHSKQE